MMAWPSFSAICMNWGFWNMPLMACMYLVGSKLAGSGIGGMPAMGLAAPGPPGPSGPT